MAAAVTSVDIVVCRPRSVVVGSKLYSLQPASKHGSGERGNGRVSFTTGSGNNYAPTDWHVAVAEAAAQSVQEASCGWCSNKTMLVS